jgi:LmbE family N-acetylglucosaminyl deacetylase
MRILVVAPHADDEVAGCGGMIARRTATGHTVDLVVMATGGLHHRHLSRAATLAERYEEMAKAAAILGLNSARVLYEGLDMRLDTLPLLDLVSKLDGILDNGSYDQVFIPYSSHNHDHQVTYTACIGALRPGARKEAPKLIALYEYVYAGWPPVAVPGGRWYFDITGFLNKKIAAFEAYASQVKPWPHPCSPRALELLAATRGMECGHEHAELFYLLRLVE